MLCESSGTISDNGAEKAAKLTIWLENDLPNRTRALRDQAPLHFIDLGCYQKGLNGGLTVLSVPSEQGFAEFKAIGV